MSGLRATSRVDATQLVEGHEDDSLDRTKLWFQDLDHCRVLRIELQDPTSSTCWRVVNSLGQLDCVKRGYLSCYRHELSILEPWVCSDQTRQGIFICVMPSKSDHSGSIVYDESYLYSTRHSEWRFVADLHDRGIRHRSDNRSPNCPPIVESDMEDMSPFGAMSFRSKHPVHLGWFKPHVLLTRKRFPDSRWPLHPSDARKRNRTRVRRRSILRVTIGAKV
jgi:hypothetical protein